MQNPFDALGVPEQGAESFDLVEDSALACGECSEIVRTGRYFDDKELLIWKCSKGHTNRLSVKL